MDFLPVPHRQKLLVNPAVFKTVNHHLFTDKKLIEHKEKKWVVLPFDDVTHALLARHEVKPPSPIEHYYQWPGRWKPFAHQVETAKFLTTYERCWILNQMGCVHPDTKIVTEHGLMRIADITSPVRVLSWNDSSQRFQLSLSGGAFPKGKETLYRVITRRGEFVATGHHHIACASGEYRRVDQLSPGDRTCSCSLPQTTEGLDQLLSTLDVAHCSQTDADCAEHYVNAARLCGQQLLMDLGSDPVSVPSLDDALRFGMSYDQISYESLCGVHMDGQPEQALRRNHHGLLNVLQSMQDCSPQFAEREEVLEGLVGSLSAAHNQSEHHTQVHMTSSQQSLLQQAAHHTTRVTAAHAASDFAYPWGSVTSAYKPLNSITSDLDEVVSVEPIGEHVYYDMHVVGTENYVCESGIVHHNTGKTMAALWAADYLMSRGLVKSTMILSPLSTLDRVWGDALWENFYHRKFEVVHGSQAKRLKALNTPANFYIINHDGLKIKSVSEALAKRSDINLVILDESAVFRNNKAQRYKALWDFAGPDSGRMLWCLTGAPMPNGPEDLWAQARLVNPALVPKYFSRFRDQMMIKVNQFKYVPKKGWEEECYKIMRPAIRFKTEDCLDLPPVTHTTYQVDMSKLQAKAYEEMKQRCIAEAREGEVIALNEAIKVNKLLQIATGSVYTSDKRVVDLKATPKLSALTELIEEAGKKVIVFAPFKHAIDIIQEYLSKHLSAEKIYGETPKTKRSQIFQDFQQGDLQVLVAQPSTMAHGLTLTASSTIIWFAPCDSYEVYEQANARIRRAGQTKNQHIIHLQSSQAEARVYTKLKNREKMQGSLLDLFK